MFFLVKEHKSLAVQSEHTGRSLTVEIQIMRKDYTKWLDNRMYIIIINKRMSNGKRLW